MYDKETGRSRGFGFAVFGQPSSVAAALRDAGKMEEAEGLFAAALRGREEELGARHPDTLRSLCGLAACRPGPTGRRGPPPCWRSWMQPSTQICCG